MHNTQTNPTKAISATRKASRGASKKAATQAKNPTTINAASGASRAADGFDYAGIIAEVRAACPEGHMEGVLIAALEDHGAEGDAEQALAFIRRCVMLGTSGWAARWVRVLAVIEARILAHELRISLREGHAAATLH